jgi:hypothetical protein
VVAAFRTRPLMGEHRYLWVNATYHKVRVDGRVQSQATVVAVRVTSEGDRQGLGIDVGPSEDRAFWTAFPPESREARADGWSRRPRATLAPGSYRRCRLQIFRLNCHYFSGRRQHQCIFDRGPVNSRKFTAGRAQEVGNRGAS